MAQNANRTGVCEAALGNGGRAQKPGRVSYATRQRQPALEIAVEVCFLQDRHYYFCSTKNLPTVCSSLLANQSGHTYWSLWPETHACSACAACDLAISCKGSQKSQQRSLGKFTVQNKAISVQRVLESRCLVNLLLDMMACPAST